MAKLFNQGIALTPRQNYERKYNGARANLLLVVIVTLVNLLLVSTGSDSYFLFSAYIPYFITVIGLSWCGMLPPEYYEAPLEEYIFFDKSLFVALLILAVILTSLYLLAWFMSKKNRVGWIIFALVFFGLDTAGMLILNGFAAESIMNIVFHAWVIYYLVVGIIAHRKLLYMPEYEPVTEEEAPAAETAEGEQAAAAEAKPDSPVLRKADKDVKYRVLLEKRMFNMDICYRRVKQVNELVINGNVYDEYVALAEQPHMLEAYVDGRHIAAGYTGTHSVINVDGQQVAKKLRII
ncbi:MAG: hypothetical protein IKT37_05095 [Clostridia bacterium]|nr:hypothetical protein [Clostridia bacterium]